MSDLSIDARPNLLTPSSGQRRSCQNDEIESLRAGQIGVPKTLPDDALDHVSPRGGTRHFLRNDQAEPRPTARPSNQEQREVAPRLPVAGVENAVELFLSPQTLPRLPQGSDHG